jgi:hypothetical protein
MISSFFVKGTTFNWTPPAQVIPPPAQQDGAFVASSIAPPPAMTYAGLDATLPYGEGVGPFRALWAKAHSPASRGLTAAAAAPHTWLNYVHGRTAYIQAAGGDILTGFMSGCWIVVWTEGGARHVGHIGTVDSAPKTSPPNTTVKQAFRAKFTGGAPVGTNLTGFNPAGPWGLNEIINVCKEMDPVNFGQYTIKAKILALVTRNDHFYSMLMIERPGNVWVCGGQKRISASGQAAVLAALA